MPTCIAHTETWVDLCIRQELVGTQRLKIREEFVEHKVHMKNGEQDEFKDEVLLEQDTFDRDDRAEHLGDDVTLCMRLSVAGFAPNLNSNFSLDAISKVYKFQVIDDKAHSQTQRHLEMQKQELHNEIDEKTRRAEALKEKLRQLEDLFSRQRPSLIQANPVLADLIPKK